MRVLKTGDATVGQAWKGLRVAVELFVLYKAGKFVGSSLRKKD